MEVVAIPLSGCWQLVPDPLNRDDNERYECMRVDALGEHFEKVAGWRDHVRWAAISASPGHSISRAAGVR